MIQVEKTSFLNKLENNLRLKSNGFISATKLSAMHYSEIDNIGINSKKIDNPKDLKKIFESNYKLRAVCLDYGHDCKKYWYLIEDLKQIYCL